MARLKGGGSKVIVPGRQQHGPKRSRQRKNHSPGLTLSRSKTSFALVIPALNEECAIDSTLERALAARGEVVDGTPIDEMLVVFVNDGSTDGTQAIADRYSEVIKVRFESNRGYGAAIKAGFQATGAEVVGFMDADGTCDPRFCAQLINHMYSTGADVVLGARLNPDSEMPFVRRMGNWIFARLVGFVSGQSLTDSASGMRVIRRSSLRRMVPLPDGLHFTPAMSCVATLDPRLQIEEVPMPYKERVGRSKLSVIRDGVKFLGIILFASACYNPICTLVFLGLVFGLFGALLCWLSWGNGAAASSVAWLLGAFVFVFLQAGFISMLCHQLNYMLMGPRVLPGKGERLLQRVCKAKPMVVMGIGMFLAGLVLWAGGHVVSATGQAVLWLGAAGLIAAAGWTALGGIILRVIWAAREKQSAEWDDPFAPTAAVQGGLVSNETSRETSSRKCQQPS